MLNIKKIKEEIKKEIQDKCELDNKPMLPYEVVNFTIDYIVKKYIITLQKDSKIENIQLLQLQKDKLLAAKKSTFKLAAYELSEILGQYMKCSERIEVKDGGLQKDLITRFILSFIPIDFTDQKELDK